MKLLRTAISPLLLCALLALGPAAGQAASEESTAVAPVSSAELEQRLQQLPWPDFKAVVSAIPKLKADVDAYGAFGWQYVQANYRTYRWAKKIDKLDDAQKQELAELIQHPPRKARREP